MASQQCPKCSSTTSAAARFCPACGASLTASNVRSTVTIDAANVLPLGTQLARGSYSIGKLLGRGGFGITYLGSDNRLRRLVALKEYFPAGAMRKGTTVIPPLTRTPSDNTTARQKFLDEAKVLARFRHPSIVTVHDMFEENATAYMVMEYLSGETLLQCVERSGKPVPEAELIAIAHALTDALERVHAEGVLHRDIKPDNIMLTGTNGAVRPVLIDFGAARAFVEGATSRHSVVLSYSYAPLEQYAEQARRGPFTDVYALAATFYHMATGVEPPSALERAAGIILKRPRAVNPALSVAFDQAIMHGLEMLVHDRPQSMSALFQELIAARAVAGAGSRAKTKPEKNKGELPQPALSGHLQHIQQIARELSLGSAVQTDKLICPVCRTRAVIDPAKDTGNVRCPVCRAGELQQRIATVSADSCPHCQAGTAKFVKTDALMRCPVCRSGAITMYVKRRKLGLFPDLWARCDRCAADFHYQQQKGTLTLKELPLNSPGKNMRDLIGMPLTRKEWMDKSGKRADAIYCCAVCNSEFDKDGAGKFLWVARDRQPDRVPAQQRGVFRTPLEWAKVAKGLALDAGTHACSSCHAQFDERQAGQLTLLRAARDPYGVLALSKEKAHAIEGWRRIAAGMRNSERSGHICPACSAELTDLGKNHYQLAAYDPAADHYGAGSRYHKQQIPLTDWQRIAAGKLPARQEQLLIEEAKRELWAALLAGQYGDPAAVISYPAARMSREKVLLMVEMSQVKQRKDEFCEYDTGQVWITTQKLLYQGSRVNLTLPLDRLSACEVQQTGSPQASIASVRRIDRVKPVYLSTTAAKLVVKVDDLSLELPWNASRFAELVNSLRQRE